MSDSDNLLRSRRWADFRRRADYAPQSVYKHRTHGWEYIPIHPFGDEPEELSRLGLAPRDCHRVDAWWGIDGDRTLLESCIACLSQRPPGLYAKPTSHDDQSVFLEAIFEATHITREAFETAMVCFAEAGFPRDPTFRLRRGDSWRPVRHGPAAT